VEGIALNLSPFHSLLPIAEEAAPAATAAFSASLNSLSSVSETVPPGWRQEEGLLGPPMKGLRMEEDGGGRGGRRNSGLGSGCKVVSML